MQISLPKIKPHTIVIAISPSFRFDTCAFLCDACLVLCFKHFPQTETDADLFSFLHSKTKPSSLWSSRSPLLLLFRPHQLLGRHHGSLLSCRRRRRRRQTLGLHCPEGSVLHHHRRRRHVSRRCPRVPLFRPHGLESCAPDGGGPAPRRPCALVFCSGLGSFSFPGFDHPSLVPFFGARLVACHGVACCCLSACSFGANSLPAWLAIAAFSAATGAACLHVLAAVSPVSACCLARPFCSSPPPGFGFLGAALTAAARHPGAAQLAGFGSGLRGP